VVLKIAAVSHWRQGEPTVWQPVPPQKGVRAQWERRVITVYRDSTAALAVRVVRRVKRPSVAVSELFLRSHEFTLLWDTVPVDFTRRLLEYLALVGNTATDAGQQYRTVHPEHPPPQTPACLLHLGLHLPCTVSEVKRAFRRLAKARHPDTGGASARFIALQDAYHQALAYVQGETATESAPR